MDPVWLTIAFILGFLVKLVGLPPLVGYLIAGFILHAIGAEPGEFVQITSDLGITLLLFTIGLKLKIQNLLKPEVWASASTHMLLTTLVYAITLFALSFTGVQLFSDFDYKLSLLVAFAFSFSSTVFAVKVLEDKGEINSFHGTVSIGVLIMQDLFAVLFLVIAAGKTPNLYAVAIPFLLYILRPLLFYILNKIGHGEMLILYGFFLALIVGAEAFSFAGIKADLGALVIGMVIAGHPKSKELADTLLSFKDLFLIGFFLSIGMSGTPTFEILIIALILAIVMNFKVILYFLVLTRFRLRARTAVHTSLSLANYSEFGLIVASVGAANNWIPAEWLTIIALAMSITFLVSSPMNSNSHRIFALIREFANKFERKGSRLIYDRTINIGDAEVLIFGMSLLGISTYDQLYKRYKNKVLALDYNPEKVEKLRQEGINVVHDDSTDAEFWERVKEKPIDQVKLVMLCMNDHKSNMYTLERLRAINYSGLIAATGQYEDEVNELKQKGVDSAYNLYTEAGIGFADEVCEKLGTCGLVEDQSYHK